MTFATRGSYSIFNLDYPLMKFFCNFDCEQKTSSMIIDYWFGLSFALELLMTGLTIEEITMSYFPTTTQSFTFAALLPVDDWTAFQV